MFGHSKVRCFCERQRLIIAFDTFFLAKHFRNVGIYEYSRNLLREFCTLGQNVSDVTVRYFVDRSYTDDTVDSQSVPGCEAVETSLLRFHRLWRLGLVNVAARRAGADIIFTPSPNVLRQGTLPVAVTIHDAMPERLPAEFLDRSTSLRIHFRRSAKLASKVLTDSEHSRKDLIESYDLPAEKVAVVYLGYDRDRFNSAPPDPTAQSTLLAQLGVERPYILHHGMVQLRKNLGRLIKAYDILLSGRPNIGLQLVLAGPLGKGSEQVRQLANAQNSSRKIVFTGTLESHNLALLVKGASLCVIPSLYEGFCLPMVEAMACGIPTIAANRTSIPEVSGGALRYFDPLSEEEMAATIEDVLDHADLQAHLARAGLKRAADFSWRRCAQETLAALANRCV
jgi:glycosyltransferase involved in cell wall biosynthesis